VARHGLFPVPEMLRTGQPSTSAPSQDKSSLRGRSIPAVVQQRKAKFIEPSRKDNQSLRPCSCGS